MRVALAGATEGCSGLATALFLQPWALPCHTARRATVVVGPAQTHSCHSAFCSPYIRMRRDVLSARAVAAGLRRVARIGSLRFCIWDLSPCHVARRAAPTAGGAGAVVRCGEDEAAARAPEHGHRRRTRAAAPLCRCTPTRAQRVSRARCTRIGGCCSPTRPCPLASEYPRIPQNTPEYPRIPQNTSAYSTTPCCTRLQSVYIRLHRSTPFYTTSQYHLSVPSVHHPPHAPPSQADASFLGAEPRRRLRRTRQRRHPQRLVCYRGGARGCCMRRAWRWRCAGRSARLLSCHTTRRATAAEAVSSNGRCGTRGLLVTDTDVCASSLAPPCALPSPVSSRGCSGLAAALLQPWSAYRLATRRGGLQQRFGAAVEAATAGGRTAACTRAARGTLEGYNGSTRW